MEDGLKLSVLISKLQKIEEKFKDTHELSPEVFSLDSDEGLLLCAKVKKDGGLRSAEKPYMRVKTGLEKLI
jgi:hypothetical protein